MFATGILIVFNEDRSRDFKSYYWPLNCLAQSGSNDCLAYFLAPIGERLCVGSDARSLSGVHWSTSIVHGLSPGLRKHMLPIVMAIYWTLQRFVVDQTSATSAQVLFGTRLILLRLSNHANPFLNRK